MHTIHLISVVVHLLAVVLWAGGLLFFALAIVPLLRSGAGGAGAADLVQRLGLRFRPVAWICFGALTVSGAVNLWARGIGLGDLVRAEFWGTAFGTTLAVKLGIVAVIFSISAWHDFSVGPRATERWRESPEAAETKRLRRAASWIGRANVLLALGAIILGVLLVRGF